VQNNNGLLKTKVNWRRKFSCYNFTALEILATQLSFVDAVLTRWRKPVFLKELQLASIPPHAHVLHLGCGSVPSISVFIAQETDACIVGIDNNSIAVRLAQRYIKKKGLADRITIRFGDGMDFPVHEFDAIFIAISVWPIDRVLYHLGKNAKSSVQIICKGAKEDIALLLKQKEFQDMFSLRRTIEFPNSQLFLLTKNK
jgi:protein-L-isoaspartate O-methyltransferase